MDRESDDNTECELELDEPPPVCIPQSMAARHVTTTRLPSIPERNYKSQRVELSADDEPLPACEFLVSYKFLYDIHLMCF